jgi:hypothetical protein
MRWKLDFINNLCYIVSFIHFLGLSDARWEVSKPMHDFVYPFPMLCQYLTLICSHVSHHMRRWQGLIHLFFNSWKTTNWHRNKRDRTILLSSFMFTTYIGRCLWSTELLNDLPLAPPITIMPLSATAKIVIWRLGFCMMSTTEWMVNSRHKIYFFFRGEVQTTVHNLAFINIRAFYVAWRVCAARTHGVYRPGRWKQPVRENE